MKELKIKGSKGYYIREDGNVRSPKRESLKPKLTNSGYRFIYIKINGDFKAMYLHRLVSEYFIKNDNPEETFQVNHIDSDKLNNHYTNLEWVTPKQNIRHAMENGFDPRCAAKLSQEDVLRVCSLLQEGFRDCDISRLSGISSDTIYMVRSGNEWQNISCNYIFPVKSRYCISISTVEWICRCLESNTPIKEILSKSKSKLVDTSLLNSIRNRTSYTSISKAFTF